MEQKTAIQTTTPSPITATRLRTLISSLYVEHQSVSSLFLYLSMIVNHSISSTEVLGNLAKMGADRLEHAQSFVTSIAVQVVGDL